MVVFQMPNHIARRLEVTQYFLITSLGNSDDYLKNSIWIRKYLQYTCVS